MSQSDRDVVLVDGVRTPFAKAGTELREIHPAELGTRAVSELFTRSGVDVNQIDEVIMGNTGNPSDSVNISRVVALRSGVPLKTSAFTVHRNCASALESITTGYDKIKSGTLDVVVAGGTENMSQMPILMPKKMQDIIMRASMSKSTPQALAQLWNLLKADLGQIKAMATGDFKSSLAPIPSIMEGLTDPFVGINMGQTAEILAKEFGLSRAVQDEFAMLSHQKAVAAQKNGRLAQEIVPVFIPPKYKTIVANDIGPRENQTMEQLAKLKPYFDKRYGTVTTANACPITDGAAAVLMMSREKARALGYKPKARIRGYGFAGLEPERMGLGPVHATPLALKRAGLTLKDMDFIELNEAFAAQVLACMTAFESKKYAQEKLGLSEAVGSIDVSKLNVNGGAIALGHPVGATGTRLVLTLMKQLELTGKQFGLATLCIGGGQGGALVIEREA